MMPIPSLRLRLVIGAVLAVLAALTLSGVFLNLLFQRHVERRVESELDVHVKQLAALVAFGEDGTFELVAPPADPRFDRPLSGLYWQVETAEGVALRSRSLFESSLELPAFAPSVSEAALSEPEGPDGENLLALSKVFFLQDAAGKDQPLRLTAAVDQAEVNAAQRAFTGELAMAFALLALALLTAAFLQIFLGLSPLALLQGKVHAVRTGGAARLQGAFPSEVRLLVDEVNALLEANDKVVERAREGAADLAHGLKTPLAVLQAESRKLDEAGRSDSAAEIAAQVEAMRGRVERHLAVVRMRGPAAGPAGRTPLRPSFEKLIRAMQAMPRGDVIDWRLQVAQKTGQEAGQETGQETGQGAAAVAMIDSQDFFEVFGNLLDNARKWAVEAVEITVTSDPTEWRVDIADDGPGVPEDAIGEILRRGGRLDERRTGAGLGLAIAARVLEAYGGALTISNRPDGGALVAVRLPKRTQM